MSLSFLLFKSIHLYNINNQRNKSLLLMACDRFRLYKLFIFKKPISNWKKKYGVYFFTRRMHTKCFEITWPQKSSVRRGVTLRKCTFPLQKTLWRRSGYACVWVSQLILCELFRIPSWNFMHIQNMERGMQLYFLFLCSVLRKCLN